MGQRQSKEVQQQPMPYEKREEQFVEKREYLEAVEGDVLTVDPTILSKWGERVMKDPKNRLAASAIASSSLDAVVSQRSAMEHDIQVFSDMVDVEGSPVTNQASSGRCWLFAATNVLRVALMQKYNLKEFQFSQAYLFFYDKLEKSNYFLTSVEETRDEPLDGRLVQHLLSSPTGDGGQWDFVVSLVEKYGLVPEYLYPDSAQAKSSAKFNGFITSKLCEYALAMRDEDDADRRKQMKQSYLRQIHDILVICLGAPPQGSFTWEFRDKKDKFQSIRVSDPKDFYHRVLGFPAGEHFSLIDDPRNVKDHMYTVDRLGNVVGGTPISYVNTTMETLKEAAIKSIKANRPVFFGCDVGKFSDRDTGIMDPALLDYGLAFNTTIGTSKAQRLLLNQSQMTHAMVLTAVHIVDGKPVRWRVENSWTEAAGTKGYFVMTDKWMDEYCFQVVVHKSLAPPHLVKIWQEKKYKVLAPWDPLGSLA